VCNFVCHLVSLYGYGFLSGGKSYGRKILCALAYYPDRSSSILKVKGQRLRSPGTKTRIHEASWLQRPHLLLSDLYGDRSGAFGTEGGGVA